MHQTLSGTFFHSISHTEHGHTGKCKLSEVMSIGEVMEDE